MNPSLWFFPPRTWIYGVGVEVCGGPGGPQGRRARPRGWACPHPCGQGVGPLHLNLSPIFFINSKTYLREVSGLPRTFYSAQKYTMAILLKTVPVRVSSIQIMQIRVQNKGKRVWKSTYDGDVSTPPSLTHCLSSSNSVDKLKVTKKNFYKLGVDLVVVNMSNWCSGLQQRLWTNHIHNNI